MLVRRLAVSAAVAAGAVGALVAGALPASAAGVPVGQINCSSGRSVSSDGGAMACWSKANNTLWVCDTAADGHHPGVWYSLDRGAGINRQFNLGSGSCSGIGVANGHLLRFWAANYEGSTQHGAGGTTIQITSTSTN